jgi:hypothetical protein
MKKIHNEKKQKFLQEKNKEILEPTIQLSNGNIFNCFDPNPDYLTLKSIAIGCSNKCRFNGQTSNFYSVLEHEINVALCLWKRHKNPNLALIGLHHDDSEGCLADIPTPIKVQPEFEFWRKIENNVQNMLYKKFVGYNNFTKSEIEKLKEVDTVLLLTEANYFMPNPKLYLKNRGGLKPLKNLMTRHDYVKYNDVSLFKNRIFLRNFWMKLYYFWSKNKPIPFDNEDYRQDLYENMMTISL